jgi:glycosyltransferase involved in cell wall biosynthesis
VKWAGGGAAAPANGDANESDCSRYGPGGKGTTWYRRGMHPGRAIRVAVIIPALDEERALPRVLEALAALATGPLAAAPGGEPALLTRVLVVDNGSTDATARVAREGGALVVPEPRRGYGRACLAGLAALRPSPPDIVAFLDADCSDDPAMLSHLVAPIVSGDYDFVLGSRRRDAAGAVPAHARWGNALSVALIRWLYGFRYTDLGPFRAVRYEPLRSLQMEDPTFGWTVEMQVKALRAGLRVKEIPVPYRQRIGRSKISGTLSGSVRAGSRILWTIARLRFVGAPLSGDRARS